MWALVDCDNFFCSCERVFRPDLNGKPLVVLSNNDGCVVSRSAEAKALGVKMGMPYYKMAEQFSGAGIIARSSHYTLYGDMSRRVMSILNDEPADMFQYSIDEAFIDLKGLPAAGGLSIWGETLAGKIMRWTSIPVSIGIAPTKTLAKVAAHTVKHSSGKNKCLVLESGTQIKAILRQMPTREVWGIGRQLSKQLAAQGINTALDFCQQPRHWIKDKYHLTGERTWLELNGIDAIPTDDLSSPAKSIMTSRTFPAMVAQCEELASHVSAYAASCASRLRRQHSVCTIVTVFIEANRHRPDLPYHSAVDSATFQTPTNTTPEIVSLAVGVLRRIYRKGFFYKRAGVIVSALSSDEAVQPDLFSFDPNRAAKYRCISEAIDGINRRHGQNSIFLAGRQLSSPSPLGEPEAPS